MPKYRYSIKYSSTLFLRLLRDALPLAEPLILKGLHLRVRALVVLLQDSEQQGAGVNF